MSASRGDGRPEARETRSAPAVPPAERTGARARRAVALHLGRLRRHEAGTLDGRDPEDLHRARVATRRLRAALRVFAAAVPDERRLRLVRDLRYLGRLLGRVRDLDVQFDRLEQHRERLGRAGQAGIAALKASLGAERGLARERLRRGLASVRYAGLLEALDAWLLADGADGEADPGAELARAHRRFHNAGRAAAARPGARTLHECRIRAKRLRYALEFLDEEAGAEGRRIVARLTGLQDLLGEHQDAVVGARLARRALRSRPSLRLKASLAALAEEEARRAGVARVAFLESWPGLSGTAFRAAVESAVARAVPGAPKKKGDAEGGVP